MSGQASLTTSSTFTRDLHDPAARELWAPTLVLNQLVPGPGNTFTAVASPK